LATKKIRVYELARELGVENKVVLELSEELRIGVKSHSSSIEEPQADRVRRLADSKGLRREPEEEPTPKKAPAKKKVTSKKKAPATKKAPAKKAPAVKKPEPELEAAPTETGRKVRSTPDAGDKVAAARGEVTPETRRTAERSTESARPAARAGDTPPSVPDVGDKPEEPARPLSPSGKPIPPPPGQRRSAPPSGRRATPPPSGGGRGGGAGPRTGGAGRPGAGGRGPGGGPGGPGGGPGGGRGGPGGGRGRPGQNFRPRKKKRKRRRVAEEELQPEQHAFTPTDVPVPEGEIVVERGTTIQELAPRLNRTAADLVRLLFDAGEMVTGTQSLADEMVELIADELGATVLLVEPGAEEELELAAMFGDAEDDDEPDESALEVRPPIITVLGHVDHGKTTLLDKIREADVVSGEAGGITQHIGAYQVERDGRPITFIDTPGHEAFTAMRARGAEVTDIVVLVVAADDGVMPQTVEAINHAKAAEVPIVVAVTKADRDDADPQRVRQQLAEHELVPEEWGGDTIVNDVSGVTGDGIDQLLDSLLLVAEVEDLKADPTVPARAVVLESHLDQGRGPVATAVVGRGTLRRGDQIVAGPAWGKVRALFDDHSERLDEAGPSVPVEVLGLDDTPLAGDELRVAPDDKTARTVAEARGRRRRAEDLRHPAILSGGARLEDIFAMVQRGEVATLNLLLKADMQGSLEALTDSLRKLDKDHEEVRLSFVHRGVGGITESDINLAAVSTATVIGFNVRPDRSARDLAEHEGVDIRTYEVIYKVLEEVEQALVGMLAPEFEEVVTGEAEVREIFGIPRVGKVAGCMVTNGVITRGSGVRFLRDGTIIWKGKVASLKRFKDDVREVQAGFECGIGLENFQDLEPGDVIETYEEREVART